MKELLQYDYTAVGHVTIDLLQDGTRRVGGSAFYSALQAARLGKRALILTQGVRHEIEELLAPYRSELDLHVLPARQTTTFMTSGWGAARVQHVLAWAGSIDAELKLDTRILHLAPVAREGLANCRSRGAFVGLTPQGLLRDFSAADGQVSLEPPGRASERLAGRCDALVLSHYERAAAERLIVRGLDTGALAAVTAEGRPTTILLADGSQLSLPVPPVSQPIEELGAGDVFAAALFIRLAEDRQTESAVAFATAAAAVRMQGAGAAAIGTSAEIDARLLATLSR